MVQIVTILVCLQVPAALASLYDTILPTATPTITKDPWTCTTEPLQRYFMPPQPTGRLMDAVASYGNKLRKDCKPTLTNARGQAACDFPPHTAWCGLGTAIPTTLAAEYSSYGSAASSWWAARSSEAVDFAQYCPGRWFTAMTAVPFGAEWLNETIAMSLCHDDGAHGTTHEVSTATPAVTATESSTNTANVRTATGTASSKAIKARTLGKWAAAVTNMAAAVHLAM